MNMRQNSFALWPLLIGLSAVIVFGFAIVALSNSSTPANSLAQATMSLPPPTPPATPATGTPLPTDAPTATDVPTPDEQATWDYIATDDAWSQILLVTSAYLATTMPTEAPWPTALVENPNGENILAKEGYVIENGWFGSVGGMNVSIYAGAHQDNLAQGLLHVIDRIPGNSLEQDFLTPLQAGSVHIVSDENYRLTLLSTDGTTFYFDILGLRYADSLTEVVPTITPYMTETPSATWTPGPTSTP
jgi:hypothetical protein